MNPQQPQQLLEEHLINFVDEEPIRMLDDSAILQEVKSIAPAASGSLQTIIIDRVGTYIYRTEMSKSDSNRRIVFPTFASH